MVILYVFGGHGGCNGSRGIWDWLCFWCGMAHGGKGLISVFQGFSASIGGVFILAGGLGSRLSFYEILTISRYFLSLKSFGNSHISCL